MALTNPFKLQKLLIEAFENVERTRPAGQFEAMFNPETLTQNYRNINSSLQGLVTSGRGEQVYPVQSHDLEPDADTG